MCSHSARHWVLAKVAHLKVAGFCRCFCNRSLSGVRAPSSCWSTSFKRALLAGQSTARCASISNSQDKESSCSLCTSECIAGLSQGQDQGNEGDDKSLIVILQLQVCRARHKGTGELFAVKRSTRRFASKAHRDRSVPLPVTNATLPY